MSMIATSTQVMAIGFQLGLAFGVSFFAVCAVFAFFFGLAIASRFYLDDKFDV